MDKWNLPENCKLRVTKLQNNDLAELETQYRLRLAPDHETTAVSKPTMTEPKPKIIYVL